MRFIFFLFFLLVSRVAISQEVHVADSLMEARNFKAAIPLYQKALVNATATSEAYFEIRNNLGRCYTYEVPKDSAESFLLETERLCLATLGGKHTLYATALHDLGTFYLPVNRAADPIKSEAYLTKAMALRKELLGEKNILYAGTLNNLAILYKQIGNYTAAESLYSKSLAIKKELLGEKNPLIAGTQNNLAILYMEMGNYVSAEILFKQAIVIDKEIRGEKHPLYAGSLLNLAFMYSSMGNYADAEPLCVQATAILKETRGEKHPEYAASLNNQALLYFEMGNYQAAELLYQQTIRIREEVLGEKHPSYAQSLMNLASLYREEGNFIEAEKLYIKSLEIYRATFNKDHPSYNEVLYELSKLYLSENKPLKAIPLLIQTKNWALRRIKENFPTLSEIEKEEFFNNKIKKYFDLYNSALTTFLSHTPSDSLLAQLYDLQLATKALLLNSSAKWKSNIINSGDKKLFAKFIDWENAVKAYNAYQNKTSGFDPNTSDSLEVRANTMEKELSKTSERFNKLSERDPKTWQDIKSKLVAGETAVEVIRLQKFGTYQKNNPNDSRSPHTIYGLTNTVQYAFLIVSFNSNAPEMRLLENGNAIEKGLKYYRNCIEQGVEDKLSYDLFWKNLALQLKELKTNKVYFSPDGLYHQVSMSTLYNPETKKYLMDEIRIVNLTNTKDILYEEPDETVTKYALLLGDPEFGSRYNSLPGTEKEVEAIGESLRQNNWEPEILTGRSAHEIAIKDMSKPNVLHIATHGYFEPQLEESVDERNQRRPGRYVKSNPLWRSGLILSKDPTKDTLSWNNDGILTAYEAMNLNLDNTDLVVLSACETGLGDIRNGEGVYGLQRAFKVAGARMVLMSLWKVSDESAAEFMRIFYDQWLNDFSARQAFETTRALIRAKYPDPKTWGAFVLVGV